MILAIEFPDNFSPFHSQYTEGCIVSLIRILLRWLRLTVGPRLLDNSHGSQISLTPDTTQSLFPAPLPPHQGATSVCWGHGL